MNPSAFLSDLEAKPAALERLASALDRQDPFIGIPTAVRRLVLLGMGSSRFAASVAARRMRGRGIDAFADYASADPGPMGGAETLVVVISASGESPEALHAAARHRGRSPVLAITNEPGSSIASGADLVVDLVAGDESGGVACRTFQHTGLLLRALEDHLVGERTDVATLCRRAATASDDLLTRRPAWLVGVLAALDGPHGVYVLAPAERLSSAEQAALMIREGPRRPAVGCETGDWAHVDVYLTRTLDYRALIFAGSRYEGEALRWLHERGATFIGVGAALEGASQNVRYADDHDPEVALHVETLVAELVAAEWWRAASSAG